MAMLVFLAANFLLSLPFRYIGSGEVYSYLPPRLAFLGLALIVPGMALGAFLGLRTYRAPRRIAMRAGVGVGALIGWTSFFTLAWAANTFDLDSRDQAFRATVFPGLEGSLISPAFLPLVLIGTLVVMFALYSRNATFQQRRRIALAGAALPLLAGFTIIATGFDPLGVAGALISTVSAALGGWIGGFGYARAGGDEMMPPGARLRDSSKHSQSEERG